MKIDLRRCILMTAALVGLGSFHTSAFGIIVGDPAGSPADSPSLHVDANVTSSPYGGVVGIDVAGYGPGSGVLLKTNDPTYSYVLTAAHVVDAPRNNSVQSGTNVTVHVNYSGNNSSLFNASAVYVNPAWYVNTGTVNDDLAIIRLTGKVPAGVPTYNIFRTPSVIGDAAKLMTLVGYGNYGDGVSGQVLGSGSTVVKRTGQNVADLLGGDDEATSTNEVYAFDFDRPNGSNGPTGGSSLGNRNEVNFGIGDSGGPAFVTVGSELQIYGINTFGLNGDNIGGSASDAFPTFGSGGGGMLVSAYAGFIDQYAVPEPSSLLAMASVGGLLAMRPRRSKR